MDIQKSIRLAMAHRKMNQRQFAYASKITPTFISYILNGKHQPNITSIERMAAAVEMSVSEFIALGEENI